MSESRVDDARPMARPRSAPTGGVDDPAEAGRGPLRLPAALSILALVAIAGGLLAAFPLLLTAMLGVELVAQAEGRWDATWNDGDLGISATGAVALLVLVGLAAAAGAGIGGVGRFGRRGAAVAAVLGVLLVAAGAFALVTVMRS